MIVSTHYYKGRKFVFNKALNTFSIQLYSKMAKPTAAMSCTSLSDKQQEIFYIHHPTGRIIHTNVTGSGHNVLIVNTHRYKCLSEFPVPVHAAACSPAR